MSLFFFFFFCFMYALAIFFMLCGPGKWNNLFTAELQVTNTSSSELSVTNATAQYLLGKKLSFYMYSLWSSSLSLHVWCYLTILFSFSTSSFLSLSPPPLSLSLPCHSDGLSLFLSALTSPSTLQIHLILSCVQSFDLLQMVTGWSVTMCSWAWPEECVAQSSGWTHPHST